MNTDWSPISQKVFCLFKKQANKILAQGRKPSLEEIKDYLSKEEKITLSLKEHKIALKWYQNIFELGYLKNFITNPDINDIIVHNHKTCQFLGSNIASSANLPSLTNEDYLESLTALANLHKVDWNYRQSFASFAVTIYQTNMRATIVHQGLTPLGSDAKLFLRKIQTSPLDLDKFCIDKEIIAKLKQMILKKENILIAGATTSGKTTLAKTLLAIIPPEEHLIILEDTHEIIPPGPHVTNLLSQDKEGKDLASYCAYALRMMPHRIILGEMRSKEVVPFILSMNTGHKGMLSTVHASSAIDAIYRVATLFSLYQNISTINYQTVIELICKNIDTVIFLQDRKIVEISKILGQENGRPFYEHIYKNPTLPPNEFPLDN